jgi:hypothetical protein
MAKRTSTRYRDKDTGRFVSKSTWTRSHAHGGTRYKRTKVLVRTPVKKKRPVRVVPPEIEEPQTFEDLDDFEDFMDDYKGEYETEEFGGGFDSPGGKKK